MQNIKPVLSGNTIKDNVESIDKVWFKPCEVAFLTGLDEKWLEAARAGRKEIDGPPWIKIGDKKTSPIRYPAKDLINWMESFSKFISPNVPFSSYSSYAQNAKSTDFWPFVIFKDGSIEELFSSINSSSFDTNRGSRVLIWLSKEYIPQKLL